MIGIFDSGVGGLTVARAIMQQIPEYDIVYFGDTAHTPYGTKSSETVIGYTINNVIPLQVLRRLRFSNNFLFLSLK
jgi:glutamate racemase